MNNVAIPRITERKIIVLKKPNGSKQYLVTIPKQYAAELERNSVDTLLIIYNDGLGCFPVSGPHTEKAVLTFLNKHKDLRRLFATEKRFKDRDKDEGILHRTRKSSSAFDSVANPKECESKRLPITA